MFITAYLRVSNLRRLPPKHPTIIAAVHNPDSPKRYSLSVAQMISVPSYSKAITIVPHIRKESKLTV